MTPPRSRPATPVDLPAIRALHAENWRADYAALVPAAVMRARLDPWMERYWAAGLPRGLMGLVVSAGPDLLGFATFDPDRDGTAFIENLHVAKSARCRGVGRALISAIARHAPDRPIRREVMAGNTAARATYRAWRGLEGTVFAGSLLDQAQLEVPVSWPSGQALLQALETEQA